MLSINRKNLSTEQITRIQTDLTVHVPNYAQPKTFKQYTFFELAPNFVRVPRFYALRENFQKTIPAPVLLDQDHKLEGNLYDTVENPQKQIFEDLLHRLYEIGGATLILGCGGGKTNIGIAVIIACKQKCAILCHQNFLIKQWRERLTTFAPTLRVGIIQQNKCESKNVDVVLCSIHSLLSARVYPIEDLRFGLIIIDEAHHVSAPTFSQCLNQLQYNISLGLTATPKRKDGLEQMVYDLVGPQYLAPIRPPKKCQVNMVTFSEGKQKVIEYRNGMIGMSRMITMLTKERKRNMGLVKIVQFLKQQYPKRQGLLLSDRVDHLQTLHKHLGPELSAIICGKINTDPPEDKKAEPQFNKFITLSTFAMFAEAVDFPGDFIILTTPKSSIEQAVGRVLRGHSSYIPVVIDIIDPYSIFYGMANKRQKYYKRAQFTVIHLNMNDLL